MFLSTANLKHHVAAASRGRYALNSIALTPNGTMSTDGHSLLFTPYPDADPKDAPKIDGVDPKTPAPQVEPFLLDLGDAGKAAAMLGKPRRHAPAVTQFIQAEISDDAIVLGVTDLANAQTMKARRMDGVYPEVGAVIPDYDKAMAVSVNLDQLVRSLKALRGATSDEVVTIRIIDDQQAVGFSCKDGTAMLCMPVQVDKPEEHIPDQLAKLRTNAEGPPATPVAPPAAPEDDNEDEGESSIPTETEMQEAQEVFDAQPVMPEPTVAATATRPQLAKPRRRRHKSVPVESELAEIING